MIDLNPIKARLDAATPGEWKTGTNSQRKGLQNIVVQNEGATEYVATYLYPDDADLIAHAPADLRALIAEVEQERKARLALAKDYIRTVWFFCPQCWDSISNCEATIAELTGKSEREVSWQYAGEAKNHKRTHPESERQARARDELHKLRDEVERLREEAVAITDGWWCPTCKHEVQPEHVTFEETHDTRCGGCGGRVVDLCEQESDAPQINALTAAADAMEECERLHKAIAKRDAIIARLCEAGSRYIYESEQHNRRCGHMPPNDVISPRNDLRAAFDAAKGATR